jgi:DNA oxidative demethylase
VAHDGTLPTSRRKPLSAPPLRRKPGRIDGLHYDAGFLSDVDRAALVTFLGSLTPIWEMRFSTVRGPPAGESQRRLLRPVYWLGNWQFACLDYYRPPHGVVGRCVAAEPFPPLLQRLVSKMEERAHRMFRSEPDMPKGWHLNTCLVNYYGSRLEGDRWVDTARVGEHKDFEPGPVASLSLGERALFQFVSSAKASELEGVVKTQWLDDGGLQLFGGTRWKSQTFHRVQRVDTKGGHTFVTKVDGFQTRRINLTFRYVPDEHVLTFNQLPPEAKLDVVGYVEQLAQTSGFYRRALSEGRLGT